MHAEGTYILQASDWRSTYLAIFICQLYNVADLIAAAMDNERADRRILCRYASTVIPILLPR